MLRVAVTVGLSALFAVAAYREAQRFEREVGRTPFGWSPVAWAALMALGLVGLGLLAVGLGLLAVGERVGRAKHKKALAASGLHG